MRVRGTRIAVGGAALLAGVAVLAGCASGSGAASGPASGPVSGAATSSSASAGPATDSASASSTRPEAWVRGTTVVLTNDTGTAVKVGSLSGYGDKMPETDESALAAGASLTESEEWRASSGTSVAFRVVYAADDVLELRVYNPAVGTPGVMWRKGYSVMNWSSDGQYAISGDETFDENTSQTLQMEGHTVAVSRGADDGDNKNWTVDLQ